MSVSEDTLAEVKRLSISGLRHELILGAMIRAELVGIRADIKALTAVLIRLFGAALEPEKEELVRQCPEAEDGA